MGIVGAGEYFEGSEVSLNDYSTFNVVIRLRELESVCA